MTQGMHGMQSRMHSATGVEYTRNITNDMATNWSHLVTNDAMMTVSTVSFHQFSPRNSQALSIAAIATESALDGWSWIAQRQSRAFSHLGRLLGSCEERHIYGITMRHHVQQIGMLQRIDVWTFGQCVEIKRAGQTLVELCSCESDLKRPKDVQSATGLKIKMFEMRWKRPQEWRTVEQIQN